METLIFLESRMGSGEAPGRSMQILDEQPLVVHQLERLRQCRQADGGVIITTESREDDIVLRTGLEHEAPVYRGPAEDLLGTFARAADRYRSDTIVRVKSDETDLNPLEIDLAIQSYAAGELDYVAESGVEIFSSQLLFTAARESRRDAERKDVTLFVRSRPQRFQLERPTI